MTGKNRIIEAKTIDNIESELKSIFSIDQDNITIQNVSAGDASLTDGQEVTTWATETKIKQYKKDAERLSKKAEKLGINDFITITKTGNVRNAYWVRILVDVKRDGEHIYSEQLIPDGEKGIRDGEVVGMTKQYEVIVSGKPLKIEGWYVAGKAEHMQDEKGNYHTLVKGYNIRKDDVKSCGPLCEHCGYKRRRNATYILKNEAGETKQVWSSCVDDFTGHSGADDIADLMGSSWKIFTIGDESGEDDEFYRNEKITAYPVEKYIAYVSQDMEKNGFIPASDPASTAWGAIGRLEGGEALKPEHQEKAKAVIEWAKSIENPDSSYMDNIKTIAHLEYFPKSMIGVAGSIVQAYNKSMASKAENDSLSEHFGSVGEKIKGIKAKIVSIKPIDSYYGTTFLYVFKADSGHVFKWFSSRNVGGDVGNSVLVSGTIKAHDEYRGGKQTSLTRAKIDVVDNNGNVLESIGDK